MGDFFHILHLHKNMNFYYNFHIRKRKEAANANFAYIFAYRKTVFDRCFSFVFYPEKWHVLCDKQIVNIPPVGGGGVKMPKNCEKFGIKLMRLLFCAICFITIFSSSVLAITCGANEQKFTDPNLSENNEKCIVLNDGTIADDGTSDTFPFSVDINITNANKKYFIFTLSAGGEFWVDWGAPGANGEPQYQYINRNTGDDSYDKAYIEYRHDYANTGEYTIKFGGMATKYAGTYTVNTHATGPYCHECIFYDRDNYEGKTNTPTTTFLLGWSLPRIKYLCDLEYEKPAEERLVPQQTFWPKVVTVDNYGTRGYVTGLNGCVGCVFPTIDSGNGRVLQPYFVGTFMDEKLTKPIPQNLFFDSTRNMGIYGQPVATMFSHTFDGAQIPGALPDGLFSSLSGKYMGSLFICTFSRTKGTEDNPLKMPDENSTYFFGHLNTPAGAMFLRTFAGSSINGQIPWNKFLGDLTGPPAATMFMLTFDGCSNMETKLPPNLFDGINGPMNSSWSTNHWNNSQYDGTFRNCRKIYGEIPSNYDNEGQSFFGIINGGYTGAQMYNAVFSGCTNLGRDTIGGAPAHGIPDKLFGKFWLDEINKIYSPGNGSMFSNAFLNCTGLIGEIPEHLFEGIETPGGSGFASTFSGCTNLTLDLNTSNLFVNMCDDKYGASAYHNTFHDVPGVHGVLRNGFFGTRNCGASGLQSSMFNGTFSISDGKPTNGITEIESGAFGKLTGAPAASMFSGTFKNNKNLVSPIPAGLFGNMNGNAAGSMFANTFYGCSNLPGPLPPHLFYDPETGIGVHGNVAPAMYEGTFNGCSSLTGRLYDYMFGDFNENQTYYRPYVNTFNGCINLGFVDGQTTQIPDHLFGLKSGTTSFCNPSDTRYCSPGTFQTTFKNVMGLSGPIHEKLFGEIYGTIRPYIFNGTFNGAENITGFKILTHNPDAPEETTFIDYIPSDFMENLKLTSFEYNEERKTSGATYINNKIYNPQPTYYDDKLATDNNGDVILDDDGNPTYITNNQKIVWSKQNRFNNMFAGTQLRTESCADNMYKYNIYFDWDGPGAISCKQCPSQYPNSVSGANSVVRETRTLYDTCNAEMMTNDCHDADAARTTCFANVSYNYNFEKYNFTNEETNVINETNKRSGDTPHYSINSADGFYLNLPAPTRKHYTMKWYTDSNVDEPDMETLVTNNTKLAGDVDLYAQWNPIEYSVNYMDGSINMANNVTTYWDENDVPPSSINVLSTDDERTITNPTKHGYVFDGWCFTQNCSNDEQKKKGENNYVLPMDVFDNITSNGITLYAKWTAKEYNITYMDGDIDMLDDEYINNYWDENDEHPRNYTIETPTKTVSRPHKHGYTFARWRVVDADAFEDYTVENYAVPPDELGNKTLYAQWVEVTCPDDNATINDGNECECITEYHPIYNDNDEIILCESDEFICESGKWWHFGDGENDKICLISADNAPNKPRVAFMIDGKNYYAPLMHDDNVKIHEYSNMKLRVKIGNDIYNAYDESVR